MPKISILLPVHNGEKYLDSLLLSFRKQSFTDFICYVIDDGCTDGSTRIIRKYCTVDTRFQMLGQAHLGRFSAYNLGLKQRLFEFTLFWDPEDEPSPQLLEYLYHACQEQHMAIAGRGDYFEELVKIPAEEISYFIQSNIQSMISVALSSPMEDVLSGVLVRTALINNRRFHFGSQKYADLLFFIQLLHEAQSVCFLDAMLLKKSKKTSHYGAFDPGTMAVSALDTIEEIMQYVLSIEPAYHRLGLDYCVNKAVDLAIFLRKEKGDIPYYARLRIKAICRQYWRWFVYSRQAGSLSKVYASMLCISHYLFYFVFESVQFLKKAFRKTGLYWGAHNKKLNHKELRELKKQVTLPKNRKSKFWEF